jgi:hypothetical protein
VDGSDICGSAVGVDACRGLEELLGQGVSCEEDTRGLSGCCNCTNWARASWIEALDVNHSIGKESARHFLISINGVVVQTALVREHDQA